MQHVSIIRARKTHDMLRPGATLHIAGDTPHDIPHPRQLCIIFQDLSPMKRDDIFNT